MFANYHTHTYRCRHAEGRDEEYAVKAIAEDLKILGFSDHAPNIYNEKHVSYYKMTPAELSEYCSSIAALRDKYADKITIHTGLEAEYLPDIWDKSLELWQAHPIEYLILGQHYVDYEIKDGKFGDHSYAYPYPGGDLCNSRDRLKRYVDGIIAGISTDKFTYIAHPDLITFSGDEDIYLEEMRRLILASEKYGTPLEYNLLGQREERLYPRLSFWNLVGECHGSAILGCDAHAPCDVADKTDELIARDTLRALNVKILDNVELRSIK